MNFQAFKSSHSYFDSICLHTHWWSFQLPRLIYSIAITFEHLRAVCCCSFRDPICHGSSRRIGAPHFKLQSPFRFPTHDSTRNSTENKHVLGKFRGKSPLRFSLDTYLIANKLLVVRWAEHITSDDSSKLRRFSRISWRAHGQKTRFRRKMWKTLSVTGQSNPGEHPEARPKLMSLLY